MNFIESARFVLYKIYNQLAIRDAPLFILDLFLPILTTTTWKEALQREMKDAKTFNTIEELLADLHEHRESVVLTSEKVTYTFNNASSNQPSWVTFNFDCTGTTSGGIWLDCSSDGNSTWDFCDNSAS